MATVESINARKCVMGLRSLGETSPMLGVWVWSSSKRYSPKSQKFPTRNSEIRSCEMPDVRAMLFSTFCWSWPMRLFPIALFVSLLFVTDANSTTVTVHECIGANGERLFSDHGECANASVRTLLLSVAPTVAPPTPKSERVQGHRRHRARRVSAADSTESYLCTSANRSWYQHTPCSASSDKKSGPVRQTPVPRHHACREIDRPASVLRQGHDRDERAGPYAKATGKDPCR